MNAELGFLCFMSAFLNGKQENQDKPEQDKSGHINVLSFPVVYRLTTESP